jgi:anti-anti-sigma regulatory factor
MAVELFDVEQCEDITVVHLPDMKYFDTERYADLRRELVEFAEQERPKKLLILFSRVHYCSTALINALMLVRERVESEEGCIRLCGMNETAREVFDNLKLSGTVFSIYKNEADAREAF